jgi:uncharacterized protein YjbJ (UPF0337 family)
MINQQVLQGNWNEIKGKLRSKWGQLTNDDVKNFDGNLDQLLGLIQKKTGEGRESIERFLNEATANGSSALSHVTEPVSEFAHQTGARIHEGATHAAEAVQDGYESLNRGYEEAEGMVRRHPGESAALCFGAGVLTGLVVALLIHRK